MYDDRGETYWLESFLREGLLNLKTSNVILVLLNDVFRMLVERWRRAGHIASQCTSKVFFQNPMTTSKRPSPATVTYALVFFLLYCSSLVYQNACTSHSRITGCHASHPTTLATVLDSSWYVAFASLSDLKKIQHFFTETWTKRGILKAVWLENYRDNRPYEMEN